MYLEDPFLYLGFNGLRSIGVGSILLFFGLNDYINKLL